MPLIVFDSCLMGTHFAVWKTRSEPTHNLQGAVPELVEYKYYDQQQGSIAFLNRCCQSYLQGQDSDDIEFWVGRGPGSFTGIKISLAYARGLQATGKSWQLKSFSTLMALADHLAQSPFQDSIVFTRATAASGYFALVQGRKVDIGRCDLQHRGARLYLESSGELNSSSLFQDPDLAIYLLGEWAELQEHLQRVSQSRVSHQVLSHDQGWWIDAVTTMIKDSPLSSLQNHLNPHYVRRSTPEERMLLNESK